MADRPILFSAPMIRALLDGRKTQTRRVIKPQPYNRDGDFVNISIASAARYSKGADGRMYFAFNHPRGGPLTAYVAKINVGDRLWVRETWRAHGWYGDCVEIAYKAQQGQVGWTEQHQQIKYPDGDRNAFKYYAPKGPNFWRSSIHMPRWASRITLIVEGVKVERLQDISEEDAIAEGVPDDWNYSGSGDGIYCARCRGFGVHGAFGAGYGVTEVDCAECETSKLRYRNLWNSINGPGAWEQNPWVAAYSFRVIKGNIDQIEADHGG